MLQATQPPQPPAKVGDAPQVTADTKQPLTGYLYAVGASLGVRIANSEFGVSGNQLDNHRNNFFDVLERVQFFDGDGVLVNRLILNVRGLIVQIVHHDDSPRTVIVMIGDNIHMMPLAELIFIFLHLAKRFF
jgi:hypothetical protein